MDQTTKAVKAAVLIYRVSTILALVLTFALFIYSDGSTLTRTVVFMAWMALGVYSLIQMLSDALSGQHKKEQNFRNTISLWEQNTADHAAAMRYFALIIVFSTVLKLAVPFVLWLVFR